MRLKAGSINLLLLLLVLMLAARIWLQPGTESTAQSNRLTDIDPETVQTLSLLARGRPDIELEKRGGRWALTRPIAGPAKAKPVEALLGIAAQPSLTRFSAAGRDLEPFGLAQSGLRLRLDQHEIAFGTTDPVYFRRYVLYGDQVHLIEDRAYHHLVSGAEALLDTTEDRKKP